MTRPLGKARTIESGLRIQEVADNCGPLLWEPYIPARAIVGSAMGAAAPVDAYGKEGAPVQAIYEALADQLGALGAKA